MVFVRGSGTFMRDPLLVELKLSVCVHGLRWPLPCFACHLLLNVLCEIGNTSDDDMPLALVIKIVEGLFCPDS